MDSESWRTIFIVAGIVWFACGGYLFIRRAKKYQEEQEIKEKKRVNNAPKSK